MTVELLLFCFIFHVLNANQKSGSVLSCSVPSALSTSWSALHLEVQDRKLPPREKIKSHLLFCDPPVEQPKQIEEVLIY